MPTYVYKFIETGETVEVQQSFTDDTLTEFAHPATGAVMPVKKVFLPVGVTFKGDGFYKTDSRASAKTSKRNGDSGSSDSGSSDSGSSGSSAAKTSSDSGGASTSSASKSDGSGSSASSGSSAGTSSGD